MHGRQAAEQQMHTKIHNYTNWYLNENTDDFTIVIQSIITKLCTHIAFFE